MIEEMPRHGSEQPELQIVPLEKEPEVPIVPPQVVEEIIANIDNVEREEDERQQEIEHIKKPKLN